MSEQNEIAILQSRYDELIEIYNEKEYEKLLIKATDFCKNYPKNIFGFNILALAYKNTGNIDKSKELYERLVAANPSEPSIYTNAGNLFHSLGNMNKAIDCHNKAINIDPNCIGSFNGLGLALFNQGKFDEAVSYYDKILEIDSSQTYVNVNIANCLRSKQLFEEAGIYYGKHPSKISQAQKLECLYRVGNYDEFFECLDRFIKKFGHTPLSGALSAHASIVLSRDDNLPFCKNPFSFIRKTNISKDNASKELIKNFISDFNNLQISKKDQSLLKNGFQSSGNIFLQQTKSIQLMKDIILKAISDYKKSFSKSKSGIIVDWPNDFTLYGWLIMINDQGYLSPHIHKEGWLSGSLYLNVPEELEGSDGNIMFSLDGNQYPKNDKQFSNHILDINTGDLVLFPSSIFHSTIPFSSKKNRVTLAFDVRPKNLEDIVI